MPARKSSGKGPAPHGSVPLRAAVLRAGGEPLRMEDLRLEPPRPDEILVRLAASGVCHTDIGLWEYGESGPVILGHEGAGVVQAVGAEVQGLSPGDHVVLSYQSCGHCPECLAGRPVHCENFWDANFGFARLDGSNAYSDGVRGHFFGQSSFATHTLATARNIVRVDKDLPLHLLAPLGCGLQTGAGTVLNSLAVGAGESVLVLGAGSVGLAAVMAARIAGASPVIAVDTVPERLALAEELGATHAVRTERDAGAADVAARIGKIAPRGVDHAVETTGSGAMHSLSLDILAPGGSTALLTGEAAPASLSGGRRAMSVIQGDAVPQRFIPALIGHFRAGRFPFDRLVRFYDFADVNRAMADSLAGTTVKPVLRIAELSEIEAGMAPPTRRGRVSGGRDFA
ncbi:Alcohol dehydrogenase GroES domain protein [Desulfovibrio sp. X2]|uniref:NAD(P)-dependent alcohol dehydrogenase n=1 Tax=Desulfovibrio sp. X2 TaxID=941449 RepID=UPI000358F14D|nr:NAD(P)-dependent alcohol dehydrogenase [Desulfovibrio sp. X2]EPR39850.1 Alcohol dehydrogenase GroES domain protein [Desulfovibrio sp. X2]